MKRIAAMALGAAMMITPAMADLNQFYKGSSGQWSIEGYYGDKNFCAAKTYWDNGNSYMSLFNMEGSDVISLYIHNDSWNIRGDYGSTYDGATSFSGNAGSDYLTGAFELKDRNTIIFRNLTDEFLTDWIKFRTLTVDMPNNVPDFTIGLVGTRDSVDMLAECIQMLNGEGDE